MTRSARAGGKRSAAKPRKAGSLKGRISAKTKRLATFVDHATDAFLLLDDDWTVLDVNRQACEGLGYSSEELIGKHKSDFDVGLDEMSIQRLKQRMLAGEVITFETRHRRKDGTSFPVEVRVSRFEQDGGRYLCLVRDISERKQAEDELRASEESFRTLIQFSFDVYWETDAQHRFTRQEFGPDVASLRPQDPELVVAYARPIGKIPWELPFLEPDAEAWRKHREALEAHQPFRDFEVARPAADGGKRYISVSGLPMFDKSGTFIGYRGVERDITERKKAEVELRESEERFRTLVQFSFDAYWETDAQHRLTRQEIGPDVASLRPQGPEWVPAFAHPVGKRPWELPFLEPGAEAWRKLLEAGEARQPVRDFEVARPAADGGKRYISVSGLPMFDKSGTFLGYRGVARDITARKRADEALFVAQAEIAHISRLTTMGELTASIAHEINQPLTGVVSSGNACLRYLADNVSDIEAARRAVERIIRDAMRANEVIKRIRALATKSPAKKIRLDINEVVSETTSLVRPELQSQNISLHTELVKGLAPVIGDPIELQQVLLNLVLNAKEAMSAVDDPPFEVTVRTEQIAPNEVLTSVRDTGPGVDEAELDRMFEAFHTTKPTGMGIGLAISRSIVEAHGGRLWAKPNQPRGVVLQFTVPVWQEEKQ